MEKIVQELIGWIRDEVSGAGAKGTVCGLSGGIDSTVTAYLCRQAFPEDNLALIMPCHSLPDDEEDARLASEQFSFKVEKVDLCRLFDTILQIYQADQVGLSNKKSLAIANLKPRLRMVTLYYYANINSYLVIGTGNKSELTVGYFTKYGDGGVDLLPLGNLTKTEVREIAKFINVPKKIISKHPSAGLWEGQTDEGEMGITYEELDRYILSGLAEPEIEAKIERMAQASEHKRSLPKLGPKLIT